MDRLDEGLKPACVAGCTAHALDFKRPNVASRETREEYGKGVLMNRLKDR
jgi:Fe-S-cluster-containing dehydrogenase component